MSNEKPVNRYLRLGLLWLGITIAVVTVVTPVVIVAWWYLSGSSDVDQSFVTGRPDLTVGCDASCPSWAKSHATDFFDSKTFPISKANNLQIAISQLMMSRAPDTILIKFQTTPKGLGQYLRGKAKLKVSSAAVLSSQDAESYLSHGGFPYSRLTWWPPKATKTPLAVYEADLPFALNHYVFVDRSTCEVTILGNASRGR